MARVVAPFGMCFALLKCKVLLPDRTTVVSQSILGEKEVTNVDRFTHLGSCMTKDEGTTLEVSKRRHKLD